MNKHIKAVLLILVLGTLGILTARYLLPLFQDQLQRSTSDAAAVKGTLRIGMDNWIGYFPLCSADMKRRMRQAGYALVCEDDQADYQSRFRRLQQGELQFAVGTVDSYVLNGAGSSFPGTIVAVIDESKGGDAIVAHRNVVKNLNALKGRNDLKIAFTPASPSEQLLKSVNEHFDLQLFGQQRSWRLESDGSSDALEKLLDKKAQVAVLWEPDVSRALAEPGIGKLIGTEDTDKLIIDVLLVERKFSREQPEAVELLLRTYFDSLHKALGNPDQLTTDVIEETKVKRDQVESMLRGVSWASLTDNGLNWFGLVPGFQPGEGLISAINSTITILRANGDFNQSPLPDQDPYRITNRQFIANLFKQQPGQQQAGKSKADPLARKFAPLDDAGWQRLREIGNLKVEPVSFRRTAAMLSLEGKQVLDRMAQKLRHYPNFRVLVKGHTGIKGDPQANLDLSAERADAVARYLTITYDMDPNRIRVLGFGSSQPLPRLSGESDRAYGYRLPRVEISLASEGY